MATNDTIGNTASDQAAAQAPTEDAPATAPVADQDALSISDLAKGVLARKLCPRVGSIRRLAEAALANEATPAKPKKKKKKPASGKVSGKASGKGSAKASGGKNRKLAKIPGQKDKKKA